MSIAGRSVVKIMGEAGGWMSEKAVVEGVLEAVVEQRLPAGAKLGEIALSEIFGCSRAEVRRALVELSARRIVELKRNRGAFVATPSPKEAGDVFQARRAIEKTIGRSAARRASGAEVARLKEHCALEGAARRSGARAEAIRLSGEFHLLLGEAGGNEVLLGFLQELVLRSSLILGLYAPTEGPFCEDDDHRRVAEAIAARDEAAAADLVDAHLRRIESGLRFHAAPPPRDLKEIFAGREAAG